MFDVDENGNLLYIPDSDSDVSGFEDGLFALPEEGEIDQLPPEESDPYGEESDFSEDESLDPSYDLDDFGENLFTGSGNNAFSGDMTLTTSGDIYIYPDGPEPELLAEDRSAYTANVQGLPNTTTLAYLEDVASGYPSWYDYMCFKTDANYSQSMCLWIGPKAVKNPSQNRIDFSGGVDCIQVNYVRNGSTSNYYYQYSKVHYDIYQIPYNSDVFLYTNVVDGYAEFDIPAGINVVGIVFLAFDIIVLSAIFRGGGKS